MKKYWKLIMTLCVVTLVGLSIFEFNRSIKQEIIDIAGDKYFFDEDKVDAQYAYSYTFAGEEIKFYLDNYYGLRGSYIMKGDRKISLFTGTNNYHDKELTRMFHIMAFNVDDYDIYENGIYLEPIVLQNDEVKIKLYEFGYNSKVIAVETGSKELNGHTVNQCKGDLSTCRFEMKVDFNELKSLVDSWGETIKRKDELPDNDMYQLIFDISSNYDVYDKHRFNFEKQYYHISEAILNDGSGYVSITSNTVEGYRDDDYHLTKQQMDDFHVFLESCEIIHDENVK